MATENPHHQPESGAVDTILVEFTDVWKPVGPEELNRSRFGRRNGPGPNPEPRQADDDQAGSAPAK